MYSINTLLVVTMVTVSLSATTPILLNTDTIPQIPQLSITKAPTHLPGFTCSKVLCKNNDNNNSNVDNILLQLIKNFINVPLLLDKVNILIGLRDMYEAATTVRVSPTNTTASPIAPNVTACAETTADWDSAVGYHCCPPTIDPSKIVDFKFENYPSPVIKVRRPAHKAMQDESWLADYNRAMAIMKSLPKSDPRSFMQQYSVHCAYCDGSYQLLNHPNERLEIHMTWLFYPFHRWYLFFFERMLGKFINKPDFALPYWNWDHPDGMRIPDMYKDINSPLYDPMRDVNHQTAVIDLAFHNSTESGYSDEKQVQENLLLVRKLVFDTPNPLIFFGDGYHDGGQGSIEMTHNRIHSWTGSGTVPHRLNMGAFWSAARDPIFYSHHSNIDRIWTIWRNGLPGPPRLDFDRPEFLNSYFIFYDENAVPVKVYVKDALDIEKLGYKYEQQDLPWVYKTVPTPSKLVKITDELVKFPKGLVSVVKTKVVRPRKGWTKEEKDEKEEVLVIKFEVGMSKEYVSFDVYVNDDYDHKPNEKTQVKAQYAGSYTSLGHRGGMGGGGGTAKKTALTLAISALLEDIEASNDDAIEVTIVPNSGTESIVITNIMVDYIT